MPRLSIQHFRATLASGSGGGVLIRTYRELSRRPAMAAALHARDWGTWAGSPAVRG